LGSDNSVSEKSRRIREGGWVNARTFDPRDGLSLALSGRRAPVGLGAPKVGGELGRHVSSFSVTAVVSPQGQL